MPGKPLTDSLADLQAAAQDAFARGDSEAAKRLLLGTVTRFPTDKSAVLTAARGLQACGDTGAAVAVLQAALAALPGSLALQSALAALYDDLRPAPDVRALLAQAWEDDQRIHFQQARAKYKAVLRAQPNQIFALVRLLAIDGAEGRLDDAQSRHLQLVDSLRQADLDGEPWEHLAVIAYQSVVRPLPRDLYVAVCTALDRKLKALAGPPRRPALRPVAGRRMKIGYLSTLLRNHAVGHVTSALFGMHDRTRFEVHVFARPGNDDARPNLYTDLVAAGAEHFTQIPRDAREAVELIAKRDLDILIYLDGYMALKLLPVVAARPAPIQVFWLGHAGGCDLSAIDHVLVDSTVVTPGEEPLYGGKAVFLPHTFYCASPHPIGEAMSRAEAGLPEDAFVFCAFNNPEKIDWEVFQVWMRILGRVEGSVLWLSQTTSAAVAGNLKGFAAKLDIDPARLVFAARLPDKAAHLGRHALCGLFLDTFTLNAATVGLDALWSGLPVLSCAGPYFGSRLAASALKTLALEDMIVETHEEYEDRAVYLATHPGELAGIRERLAVALDRRPLFDIASFCRGLEACFEGIHRSHSPDR